MQSEMMNRPMFRSPQGEAPMPPAGGPPMQNPEAGIAALTSNMQGMTRQGLDQATSPEEAINAMRGNQLPIQARYAELAQIVGPEDAQATPPMVLTMVQPALMLGEGGGGIEGLMPAAAGEMPAPGGIGELMLAPPPQMAPPVQEFSGGGYVRGYAGGGGTINTNALMAGQGLGGAPLSGGYNTTVPSGQGFQRGAPPPRVAQQPQQSPYAAPNRAGGAANLKKYYDEDYQAYMDILAPTDEEKKSSQRDLWFDVARRGLAMASGTNPDTGAKVTGNTASRLANAFGTLPTAYAANRREMETGAQNRARQAAAQSASGRLASERQASYEASLKGRSMAPAMFEVRNASGAVVFSGNYNDPTDQAQFSRYQGQAGHSFNKVGEFDDSATVKDGGIMVVGPDNIQIGPAFPDTPEGLTQANSYAASSGVVGTSIQKMGTMDPNTPESASSGTPQFETLQLGDGTIRMFNVRNPSERTAYEREAATPGAMTINRALTASEAGQQLNSPSFIGYLSELSMDAPEPFSPTELSTLNSLIEKATAEVTDTTVGADGQRVTSSKTPRLSPQWDQAIIKAANNGIDITVPAYLRGQVANPGIPTTPDLAQGKPAIAALFENAGNYELFGTLSAFDRLFNTVMPAITFGTIGAGSEEEASVERGLVQWHESIVQSLAAATPGRDAVQTMEIFRDWLPTPNNVLTSKTDAIGTYIGLKAAMTDDITEAEARLNTPGGLSREEAEESRRGIAKARANLQAVDVMIEQLRGGPSTGVDEATMQDIMNKNSSSPAPVR